MWAGEQLCVRGRLQPADAAPEEEVSPLLREEAEAGASTSLDHSRPRHWQGDTAVSQYMFSFSYGGFHFNKDILKV